METIEVMKAGKLNPGSSTIGINRERAFDSKGALVAKSTVAGGSVSSWHHHGARQLFGFVVSGTLKLEVGPPGESVVVSTGDFFRIPPGLVHRDVNPDPSLPAVIVNILLGDGDPVVNVPGP
ncbi:MAG: cupin domain-containing protein [Thaumarchaeota archaeon]|nr:cupin domain-containing protein [Nitrososphaerota archaeon]